MKIIIILIFIAKNINISSYLNLKLIGQYSTIVKKMNKFILIFKNNSKEEFELRDYYNFNEYKDHVNEDFENFLITFRKYYCKLIIDNFYKILSSDTNNNILNKFWDFIFLYGENFVIKKLNIFFIYNSMNVLLKHENITKIFVKFIYNSNVKNNLKKYNINKNDLLLIINDLNNFFKNFSSNFENLFKELNYKLENNNIDFSSVIKILQKYFTEILKNYEDQLKKDLLEKDTFDFYQQEYFEIVKDNYLKGCKYYIDISSNTYNNFKCDKNLVKELIKI